MRSGYFAQSIGIALVWMVAQGFMGSEIAFADEIERPTIAQGTPVPKPGNAEPNFQAAFPRDRVNQITLTIAPTDWQAMQADLTAKLGPRGSAGPASEPGLVIPGSAPLENPVWVQADVEMNGQRWTHVGLRYRGNTSLITPWKTGSSKLPIKLRFDQFEDIFTDIKNQRFHGFKELSLSNNVGDDTNMRDSLMYDLLKQTGQVTPATAFYEVTVSYGEGPVSLGIYTAVETIDDTLIKRSFADNNGNLYEADGAGATLSAATSGQIQTAFQKETNAKAADWSDVQALHTALHSPDRTSQPEAWRGVLESKLDVPSFVRWLALSSVVQSWDAYGVTPHNFHLYNDARAGKLVWISWDHSTILGGGGSVAQPVTIGRENVTADWPLVRFILDDPYYQGMYVGQIDALTRDVFVTEKLVARYQEMAALLSPFAAKEGKQAAFEAAVQALSARTYERAYLAQEYLAAFR